MKKLSVTVRVSHDGNDFRYDYSGDVLNRDGDIQVTGDKGTPVRIEFTVLDGDGIEEVLFQADARKAIRVGPKDVKTCPPMLPGGEFEDEQHGDSKKVLTIKDKGNNNGEFQYALYFRAKRTGGQPEDVYCDPMIINNLN